MYFVLIFLNLCKSHIKLQSYTWIKNINALIYNLIRIIFRRASKNFEIHIPVKRLRTNFADTLKNFERQTLFVNRVNTK